MADWPSACVADANILIDLHAGGVLKEAFALPFQWMTPDVVLAELQNPPGAELLEYGLKEEALTGEQVLEVAGLVSVYRRVSTNDLFALVLAEDSAATLLTGDRHLREIAKSREVPVHGTLWVLDQLVELELLNPARAASALRAMVATGSRLPPDESTARLSRWK